MTTYSDADLKAKIQELLAAGTPGYEIGAMAIQSGIDPNQLSRATGLDLNTVLESYQGGSNHYGLNWNYVAPTTTGVLTNPEVVNPVTTPTYDNADLRARVQELLTAGTPGYQIGAMAIDSQVDPNQLARVTGIDLNTILESYQGGANHYGLDWTNPNPTTPVTPVTPPTTGVLTDPAVTGTQFGNTTTNPVAQNPGTLNKFRLGLTR